jgi:hypothetical protein
MITPKELLAQMAERKAEIEALTTYWEEYFPEHGAPAKRQFQVWLNRHAFNTVVAGIDAALQWQNKRPTEKTRLDPTKPSTLDELVAYASGCMKKLEQSDGR